MMTNGDKELQMSGNDCTARVCIVRQHAYINRHKGMQSFVPDIMDVTKDGLQRKAILILKGDLPILRALDVLDQFMKKTAQYLQRDIEPSPSELFALICGSGPAR
jgi:hypothetical protein